MKRDVDLIRTILMGLENDDNQLMTRLRDDGYSDEQIGHHIYLMGKGGLLETFESQGDGDRYPTADVRHITWSGHDFLEKVRKPAIWEAVKRKVEDAGVGCTIELLKRAVIVVSKSAFESAIT